MSPIEFCVRRPVFTTMLITSLVVLGAFSFNDLGVDLFPRADPATVTVTANLPGASPQEVSSSVVEPLEAALSSIGGIDQITAFVIEGRATITIRFVLERDLDDAASSVREKVSGAMRSLPPQTLPPVIQKADPDSDAIMTLILASDKLSLRTVSEVADKQVRRAIETVDGVGQVSLSGMQPREIHIVVDVEKLNSYGLTIDAVRDAVQRENVEVPGGFIEMGPAQLGLRTMGRIDGADQFKDIIVTTVNGTPIRISDIGYAEDAAERMVMSLFLDNGKPAVQVDVRRAPGENTIKVAEAVKARFRTLQQTMPKEITMTVSRDDSRFIQASVASLEEHLMWGSLLAAAVVMFFIRNIRAVIIAGLAIPTSIISTFALMRAMDFTLNNMTLLGMTLAVGIVIDDAIVVLENIFRYIEEKDCSPFEAAIEGTREVTLAVLATTLSLVVIFLPVAFMTGYARRFIYPFGWTMAFAILVSMIVSFTLTPMLSARLLRRSDAVGDSKTKDSGIFKKMDDWYTGSLRWSLAHPGTIIAISAVFLALTFPLNRMLGRTFIPSEDMGEFTVHTDFPDGTSLEGAEELTVALVKQLRPIEGVSHITYLAGPDKTNHAHLFVFLKPLAERTVSQQYVVTEMRRVLSAYPGYYPSVVARSPLGGGAGGFAIAANMMGPDLDRLSEYALQLLAKLQQTPSLVDAKTTVATGAPELRVAVDRERAADLGVRMSTVGNTLRMMVSGDDQISTYREGAEQYPVKIRVLESQRRDIPTIGKLTVASTTGVPVRIDNLARLERGSGTTLVRRANRQFTVDVQADVAPGYALDGAAAATRRAIAELNLPPGYSVRLAGQTEVLDETTENLMLAIMLAMIFVYMVLAAQFESFLQPLIIMLVLPLSVPFALFTLWITGRTLNLWSALGILLLLGIVKKNSILQVDYANILRSRGVPLQEAVVEACRTRLRPILMTTAAILAGLVPTALGVGIGGAQRSAIAVTIIGGQSLCLFLTLLLVPVAYVKLAALEEAGVNKRLKGWVGRLVPARLKRQEVGGRS